jgi:hypothetical protein
MNTDALSVNLLQRKASETLKAEDSQTYVSKCKNSCFANKKPWERMCKKQKCSACAECNFQSGSYILHGDGECRGSRPDDDAWHTRTGRYALNFDMHDVGGTSVAYSTFPNPWKRDDEKVTYRKPSSRLETQAFPEINRYCAQICDNLSFCKGYEIIMRGCEDVNPGTAPVSGDTCELAMARDCHCWQWVSCYVITDYKTYAKSPEAASAGVDMERGSSKTFSTSMGDLMADTLTDCDSRHRTKKWNSEIPCTVPDVEIGGNKTVLKPRSGYFCFMKNTNAAAPLEEDQEDGVEVDAYDQAEVNELESLSVGMV